MSESEVKPVRRSRRAASLTAQVLWNIQIEDNQKPLQGPSKRVSPIITESKGHTSTAGSVKAGRKRRSTDSISKIPPKQRADSKVSDKSKLSCRGHNYTTAKPVQFGDRSKHSGKLTASVAPLRNPVQPKPKQSNIATTSNRVNPILLLPVSLQPGDGTGSGDLPLLTLHPDSNLLSCFGLNAGNNSSSGSEVRPWGQSSVRFNLKPEKVYISDLSDALVRTNANKLSDNCVVQVEPLNLKMGETTVPTSTFHNRNRDSMKVRTNVVRPMCQATSSANPSRHKIGPSITVGGRSRPTPRAVSSNSLLSAIHERLLHVATNNSKQSGSKSPSPDYSCSSPEVDDLQRTKTPSCGKKNIQLRHKAVPPSGTLEYEAFKNKERRKRKPVKIPRRKPNLESQDSDDNRPLTAPSPSSSSDDNYDVNNGWRWFGKPYTSLVYNVANSRYGSRKCYPAMIRRDPEGGDTVVAVRDCVFLLSGEEGGAPYIAKVTSLWERESTGEMVASILWYYRPEHTEDLKQRDGTICEDELFGSRHQDEASVACVEDRCYVLNYSQYARVRARLARDRAWEMYDSRRIVPRLPGAIKRSGIRRTVAGESAPDPNNLFFSRKLYDIKGKRVLKYLPQPQSLFHESGNKRTMHVTSSS